jgi:putative RNA 2'-phosphotransferase
LQAVNRHGVALTLDDLRHVVATSDKKRFAFSEDRLRIRASQGHSVEVDLQ